MATEKAALPHLRDELTLQRGAEALTGAPTWTLYDPIRHKYFHIDHIGFEMLARWGLGEAEAIVDQIKAHSFFEPVVADVKRMAAFLVANGLADRSDKGITKDFLRRRHARRTSWLTWALHHYLFVRIPIVNPSRFLDALLPWVMPFYTVWARWFFAFCVVAGLYLAGRQWDTFLATFVQYTTWQGQVTMGASILISKMLHELGHAFAVRHQGGQVPIMGVAFLVMMPMLYTDTSDAWRMRYRHERLAVGLGGVKAELALASVALLLWSFAPDGILKSAFFILSTTVWIGTLAINLNPFMRFDGYYVLSDWLEVPNLQSNAFGLAKRHMRRLFLGMKSEDGPLMPMVRARRRILTVYAYTTWIYRLVLFVGIALVVYHFFFKALGLFLFAVEIGFFIVLPIFRELLAWWRLRQNIRWPGTLLRVGLVLVLGFFILGYPWRTSLSVPAVLDAAETYQVFAPASARLDHIAVQAGWQVRKGDVLYRLGDPELDFSLAQVERELSLSQMRLERAALRRQEAQDLGVLERETERLATKRRGILAQIAALTLIAPFDGVFHDQPDFVRQGLWVDKKTLLGVVTAKGVARLIGYVDQDDIASLNDDAPLMFIPDDPDSPLIKGRLAAVAPVSDRVFDEPLLASVHGGPVKVRMEPGGVLKSETGLYRLHAVMDGVNVDRRTRGVVRIDCEARSLIEVFWRAAAIAIVQEHGM